MPLCNKKADYTWVWQTIRESLPNPPRMLRYLALSSQGIPFSHTLTKSLKNTSNIMKKQLMCFLIILEVLFYTVMCLILVHYIALHSYFVHASILLLKMDRRLTVVKVMLQSHSSSKQLSKQSVDHPKYRLQTEHQTVT